MKFLKLISWVFLCASSVVASAEITKANRDDCAQVGESWVSNLFSFRLNKSFISLNCNEEFWAANESQRLDKKYFAVEESDREYRVFLMASEQDISADGDQTVSGAVELTPLTGSSQVKESRSSIRSLPGYEVIVSD